MGSGAPRDTTVTCPNECARKIRNSDSNLIRYQELDARWIQYVLGRQIAEADRWAYRPEPIDMDFWEVAQGTGVQ